MNLGYEFLQEIIITTETGRILRLDIGKQSESYRLYGVYFEASTQERTLVEFQNTKHADAKQLLAQCIKDFAAAMSSKSDKIKSLYNPCNASFVTAPDQKEILSKQSISATVSVN